MNTRQLFTTHSLEELAETAKKLRIDAAKKANTIGSKLGSNFEVALDTCKTISNVQNSLKELHDILQDLKDTKENDSQDLNNKNIHSSSENLSNAITLSLIDEAWSHQNNNRYIEAVEILEKVLETDSIFANTVRNGKSVIISDYVESICEDHSPSLEEFDRIRSFFGDEINNVYLEHHKSKISSLNSPQSISTEILRVYTEYLRWNREHRPELDKWIDEVFSELNIFLLKNLNLDIPIPTSDTPSALCERWSKWVDEIQLTRDKQFITSFFSTFGEDIDKVPQKKEILVDLFEKKISSRIVKSSKACVIWEECLNQFLKKFTPDVTCGVHDIGSVVACLDILGTIVNASEAVDPVIQLHLSAWLPKIFQRHLHILFPCAYFNSYPSSHLITFFYLILQEIRHFKLIFYETHLKKVFTLLSEEIVRRYLSQEEMQAKRILCDIAFIDNVCNTNHLNLTLKHHPRFESTQSSEFEDASSVAKAEFSRVSALLSSFHSITPPQDPPASLPFPFVSCSIECPTIVSGNSKDTGPLNSSSSSLKERHSLLSQVSMSSLDAKPQISKTLLFTEKAKMIFSQSRSLFSPQ